MLSSLVFLIWILRWSVSGEVCQHPGAGGQNCTYGVSSRQRHGTGADGKKQTSLRWPVISIQLTARTSCVVLKLLTSFKDYFYDRDTRKWGERGYDMQQRAKGGIEPLATAAKTLYIYTWDATELYWWDNFSQGKHWLKAWFTLHSSFVSLVWGSSLCKCASYSP